MPPHANSTLGIPLGVLVNITYENCMVTTEVQISSLKSDVCF